MRWFFRRRCGHQIPGIHPGVGVRSPYNGQTEGPHRVQRVQDRPMRNEAPRTMGLLHLCIVTNKSRWCFAHLRQFIPCYFVSTWPILEPPPVVNWKKKLI